MPLLVVLLRSMFVFYHSVQFNFMLAAVQMGAIQANNVEPYTFVTLFHKELDTPNLHYVTIEWPHI